ncbi:tubulin-specific chaperone E isoform X2 [Latimeria chalumnae]|uniref:tubulin-specific chaperone E isoform X2 n=1 Tax=Latimeria chalumnae TaxID=7897 RepID=UPI00313D1A74
MSDSVPSDAVGRRIVCDGEYGTVLYVGNVPPTPGCWLGVEWDSPERGKHGGTYKEVQYFSCSHPTGGSFIRPKKASFGVTFLSALKERYGLEDELDDEDKQEAGLVIGKKAVELVGFETIKAKQSQFNQLKDVSLRECAVSHAGLQNEIRLKCPHIVSLDLSKNLFSSLETVADITCQLTELKTLNLSENRLKTPVDHVSLADAFANLEVLAINCIGATFTEVLQCARMWPVLEQLYLSSNAIMFLDRPVDVMQSLTLLDLSNNPLADGNRLLKIAYLPKLEQLVLSNTGISTVHFDDVGPGCKTEMFSKLKHLVVDNNKITQWCFMNELEKLKSLQQLNCMKNPLMKTEKNPETVRQLIIAKIGQLEVLNKSKIFPDERRGAELDYRKKFGKDWQKAGGHWDSKENRLSEEFTANHPRYQLLLQKYGVPEEGELKEQQPFALRNQLLTLTIKSPDKTDQKPIERKLPDSMTIQKVKGLLCRLFKVPGSELKLSYISAKCWGHVLRLVFSVPLLQQNLQSNWRSQQS